MSGSRLRAHVLAAKQRLAEGYGQLKLRHQTGCRGVELCAAISDLRDEVLLGLYRHALDGLGTEGDRLGRQIALVAHGGYGRRDVAPFSDVDLMILRPPKAAGPIESLVQQLLSDVFDAGLDFGHSVRTIQEACQLSHQDASTCTSLVESRYLAGDRELFDRFVRRFEARVRRRGAGVVALIEAARSEERAKFGETVHLLEPNVKRSPGGLRDAQLIRWIGLARYGAREPAELVRQGVFSPEDYERFRQALDFLLWLRNEIHFAAGKPGDVLDRAEQLRIADLLHIEATAGMLPVELFMREYFRHTEKVSHLAARVGAKARSSPGRRKFWNAIFGRRVPGGLFIGPQELMATRRALAHMKGNITAAIQLADLANLYDKQIAVETWEAIHQDVPNLPSELPAAACRHFLSLLSHPGRLGELLRGLHGIGLLERFIPQFAHARGLLQFNQYHKYTVDEHSFQAVDRAVGLLLDTGPLGRVYRGIRRKEILHLALLLHDLGKGYPQEHTEVGLKIAGETAERLGLDDEDAEALKFLVHKHLVMNHLAFRRDTGDEQMIVRFAVEVGSPELLRMLYVMTAADLGAVGPDTWTTWKGEVLADLFHRAMQHLAGESLGTSREEYLESLRQAARTVLGPEGAQTIFTRRVKGLPASYLTTTDPLQIADDLRLLSHLKPGEVNTQGRYQADTHTVQFTIVTSEDVTSGIFHKLTGALTSQGLEILSAQINTLADRMVLDRFWVQDPDFSGEPPPQRLDEIRQALRQSLTNGGKPPTFRRIWTVGDSAQRTVSKAETRVRIDNSTSDRYTIIDVFTTDRRGLLYAVTRTLFEMGCSVWRAKIGTYIDQVVDVFYVTDQAGNKIEAPARLHATRRKLLEVIEAVEEGQAELRNSV